MLFDTNSSSYRHPNVLIFLIIGIFIIYKAEKIIKKDPATGRFALIPPVFFRPRRVIRHRTRRPEEQGTRHAKR
jgi:hypothetical protein